MYCKTKPYKKPCNENLDPRCKAHSYEQKDKLISKSEHKNEANCFFQSSPLVTAKKSQKQSEDNQCNDNELLEVCKDPSGFTLLTAGFKCVKAEGSFFYILNK